jgi:hypothetical protein
MRLARWASLDVYSELPVAESSVFLPTGSGSFDSLALSFDMTAEIRNEHSTIVEPVIVILGKYVPTEVDAYQKVPTSQCDFGVSKQESLRG